MKYISVVFLCIAMVSSVVAGTVGSFKAGQCTVEITSKVTCPKPPVAVVPPVVVPETPVVVAPPVVQPPKEVVVARTDLFTATPKSTSQIALSWDNANYPEAQKYAIIRSKAGGQKLDWVHIGTASSSSNGYIDSNLAENTEYVYTVYPVRKAGTYNYEMAIAVTLSAFSKTAHVYNDAQVIAAAKNSKITDIRLHAGTYTDAIGSAFTKQNRNNNRLTVRADNPKYMPTLKNVDFDLSGTSGVRFYHLNIHNNKGGSSKVFGESQTDAGLSGSVINCSFAYNKITGPPKSLTAAASTTYASGLPNMFDLGNSYNSGNTVFGNAGKWVRQFIDIRPNGHQLVAYNTATYWHFDYMRIVGQPDEGRMASGVTFIHRNSAVDNIAIYEETNKAKKTPHPDFIQGMNSGGTNPSLANILFSQNYSTQRVSKVRSIQYQGHLVQSRLRNVMYVENMFFTLSPHCLWFQGGAQEVGVHHHSCGSHNGGSNGVLRLSNHKSSNILVKDSIITWGLTNDNKGAQTEMKLMNVASMRYKAEATKLLFAGPAGDTTPTTLFTKFKAAPKYVTAGALTSEGRFRASVHFPSAPRDVKVVGTYGAITVKSLTMPTLNTPIQKYLGGEVYTYDIRYTHPGTSSWRIIRNVKIGKPVSPGYAGKLDVQVRANNIAGEGVWTNTTPITTSM